MTVWDKSKMGESEVHHKAAILIILALTYAGIALLGGIGMMIFGGISTAEVVSYVNWPTIFLLFGFFVISAQLRLSGFYDLIAGGISSRLRHPAQFLFILMVVTAGLSAFLNHDIVCYVFTPIVGAALLRKGLNPVPFLVALAIASNVGAAATLIGNPQDMMIGQIANLQFGDYILWSITPVLFALSCSCGIIWLMSQKNIQSNKPASTSKTHESIPLDKAHTIKGLVLLVIVVGLFFSPLPKEIIALAAAGIHLASPKFRTDDLLGLVDWPVLVLFMGLFVVTGSFQSTGYGDQAVHWLSQKGFDLNKPLTLILATTGLTNLINNSAAVMLLLKVVNLSNPVTSYVLALANSFGGSLIIIGSVSNIIVVQQAQQLGVTIGFRDFARLSVPLTLVALSGLFIWVVC